MESDLEFEEKTKKFFNLPKEWHSSIEDDSLMQKLQTAIQLHLNNVQTPMVWSSNVGLLSYICDSLEESCVRNVKNVAAINLALHCLSSIIDKEEHFLQVTTTKIMNNFKLSVPLLRENTSLNLSSLRVVENLLGYNSGVKWIIKNGLWEALLIPSLKCQSIFVQKCCTSVISSLILKTNGTVMFSSYIRDLELILYKFRETRHQLKEHQEDGVNEYEVAASISKLKFNTSTVLLVFYTLLTKSLGRVSVYGQLKAVFDLTSKILFRFNFEMTSQTLLRLSKMLLLSTLHRFQDQIMQFGSAEQYHLDSITSDILSLTRHMINKGFHAEYLLASFHLHEYWNTMCKRIEERNDAELSRCQTVMFIFLSLQIAPLRVVCNSSLDMGTEEDRRNFEANFNTWRRRFFSRMRIKDEQKVEMCRLLRVIRDKFASDINKANEQCIAHITHFSSYVHVIHPECGSILFQALIFLLKFKIEVTSAMEWNPRFYLHSLTLIKALMERFKIAWKEYFEFKSLLFTLCSVVWIPGITTRVKVSTLQCISSCIRVFVPTVIAQLYIRPMNTEELLAEITFDKLAETLAIYLSDTEWEVRDSALELILLCLNIPCASMDPSLFADWFLKFHLLDHTLQAVGDAEPFVQASAMCVLAASVSKMGIWVNLENANIKHKALRGVVRSGESSIRKASLDLVQALLVNSKFSPYETQTFVVPVIQSVTTDPDDEIRLAAVRLIRQHLNLELVLMGMVDGDFPKVTFQSGKIVNLEEAEVERRILNLVTNFSENGYFRALINCSSDASETVREESNSILSSIAKFLNKYNVHNKVPSYLNSNSEEEPNTFHIDVDAAVHASDDIQMHTETNALNPVMKYDSNTIECILETPDISVISRLNKEFCEVDNWWSDVSEVILKKAEIPATLGSVSSSVILEALERAETALQHTVDQKEVSKKEILLLLEDLFLVADSPQEQNESRERDCY